MSKCSRKNKNTRDGGRFLALTHDSIKSNNYRELSYSARSLLIDIGMQLNERNNGKLVACSKYLRDFGWNSNATVNKAIKELLASGLLILTRRGCKPNKASWYGLAWHCLGSGVVESEMDITGRCFESIRHEWKMQNREFLIKSRPFKNGVVLHQIAPKNNEPIQPLH